jgi:integrase
LLSHAEGVVYELIIAALRTGMRQGELRGLQWTSIDWRSRILTVRHSRCDLRKTLTSPKSNRERHIPLDNEVHDLLLRRKKDIGYVFADTGGRPFGRHRLTVFMNSLSKKVGMRHVTWHALRHTFASHLAMRGVPLNAVQTLLGHSSITTTMRYAHVAPSTLRNAIELLSSSPGPLGDLGQPAGNQWQELQSRKAA